MNTLKPAELYTHTHTHTHTTKVLLGLLCIFTILPSFAEHPRITQLIAEKQAKMKKLEDCQGTTKKLKIAGISTLGITAVGVGANIAEAVVLSDTKKDIAEAEKARDAQQAIKDKRECENDDTKMWENGECKDKPVAGESADDANQDGAEDGKSDDVEKDVAKSEETSGDKSNGESIDAAFKASCKRLTGKEPKENGAGNTKELFCFAGDIDAVTADDAKKIAKGKISTCDGGANEQDGWFAIYCGKGNLELRLYIKKKEKDFDAIAHNANGSCDAYKYGGNWIYSIDKNICYGIQAGHAWVKYDKKEYKLQSMCSVAVDKVESKGKNCWCKNDVSDNNLSFYKSYTDANTCMSECARYCANYILAAQSVLMGVK